MRMFAPLKIQSITPECSGRMYRKSPDGGIGRRVRLKIWYWQQCAGSIPVLGTKPSDEVGGLFCCAAGELVRQSGTMKKTTPAKREEGFE